jgi:hypothetical protein
MNTQRPEDNDSQRPERDATLIPFPTPPGEPAESAPEVLAGELLSDADNEAVARRCLRRGVDGLAPRMLVLVRGVAASPRAAQVKAVAAYRVRKAPRDVTRLCWFALRGHGRWITKAWTYTTHGDLRADARAARLAATRRPAGSRKKRSGPIAGPAGPRSDSRCAVGSVLVWESLSSPGS